MNRDNRKKTRMLWIVGVLMGGLCLALGSMCMGRVNDQAVIGSDPGRFYLSPQQIVVLEDLALAGNGDAAYDLAKYWELGEHNYKEAAYWLQIGAENGHPWSQHDLAYFMDEIYQEAFDVADDDTKTIQRLKKRAKFWAEKAKEQKEKVKP